jgi:hypothetical protein
MILVAKHHGRLKTKSRVLRIVEEFVVMGCDALEGPPRPCTLLVNADRDYRDRCLQTTENHVGGLLKSLPCVRAPTLPDEVPVKHRVVQFGPISVDADDTTGVLHAAYKDLRPVHVCINAWDESTKTSELVDLLKKLSNSVGISAPVANKSGKRCLPSSKRH